MLQVLVRHWARHPVLLAASCTRSGIWQIWETVPPVFEACKPSVLVYGVSRLVLDELFVVIECFSSEGGGVGVRVLPAFTVTVNCGYIIP